MNITFENLTVEQANELIQLARKWQFIYPDKTKEKDNYVLPPGTEPFKKSFEPCFVCHKDHGNLPCPNYQVTSDPF